METVFVNFIKKVSILGLSGLLIYTFLVLGKSIIGKDIIPQLSEDNSVEIIKWIVIGFFVLILITVLLAFAEKVLRPEKNKAKASKTNKEKSSVWKYILTFLIGATASYFIVSNYMLRTENESIHEYSITDFTNLADDVWDIRSTSRIGFRNHGDYITFSSRGIGVYNRELSLHKLLINDLGKISTSISGKIKEENGFWGISFIGSSNDEYYLLLKSDQIYLGFKQNKSKLSSLIDWDENFNLSEKINSITIEVVDNYLEIKINNVHFAKLDQEKSIQNISYVLSKSIMSIHDLYVN